MMICLYQFHSKGNFNEKGVGDCRNCMPSENNKFCKKYYPIPDWKENSQQVLKLTVPRTENVLFTVTS